MDEFMKKALSIVLVIAAIAALCGIGKAMDASGFELELAGTTGYGIIDMNLRAGDSTNSSKLGTIPAGEAFVIVSEGSSYFQVETSIGSGWLSKIYTMVNLPDLIPSIRYNATNSYNSLYRSCGEALDGVTGTAMYTGKTDNTKLGYAEYNMPVLYTMAKKIAAAQSAALADGYTLVLYEGFRPKSVQDAVNLTLGNLISSNAEISKAINSLGWGKGWFIAKSVSNHQKGFAIDVSLGKVNSMTEQVIDGCAISIPTDYTELEMPTAMHELSPAAASLAYGVDSKSTTDWKSVPIAGTMNDAAKLLRTYCTDAGMSPLASEWWHFNDLEARTQTGAKGSGLFAIEGNVSR